MATAVSKAAMATAPRIKPAARIFNFGAGPATMPVEVLEKAKWELVNWHEAGMSVMEMSHRGKEFVAIAAEAEADLRALAAIPADYKVLFLQGGATMQFAAVPMNLLRGAKQADYVNTGEWSKKAMAEARKYCEVRVAASSEDRKFTYVPKQSTWRCSADAAYVHICSNETIGGVEFHWTPDTGAVPLVADMSSHILSRPLDVAKYGLIYAGAQKNIGPAGLVVVIVREDLVGHACRARPTCSTTSCRRTPIPCSIRRPPFRSTSRGWCSSGCSSAGRARGHRAGERAQGRAALRLPRFAGLLLQSRSRRRTARA